MHVGISQQPDLLRFLPEAVHHGSRNVVRRVDASELVGVGKEISFQRLGVGIEIAEEEEVAARCGQEIGRRAESRLLYRSGNVIHVEAFGHDNGTGIDIAPDQPAPNLQSACRLIELVLARLKRVETLHVLHHEECSRAADDALVLEIAGNMPCGPARTQEYKGGLCGL